MTVMIYTTGSLRQGTAVCRQWLSDVQLTSRQTVRLSDCQTCFHHATLGAAKCGAATSAVAPRRRG